MYKLRVSAGFSAAHSLHGYPGDCSNLHGHNWKVTVSILCPEQDKIGMSIDFREVKRVLNNVISEFDHKYLNDLDCFDGKNPTSEELAKSFFSMLKRQYHDLGTDLAEVEIWESENSSVIYFE